MANHPDFLEIEHKFLVEPSFDLADFRSRAAALGYRDSTELLVEDTYFISPHQPGLIFRHRFDQERQELTIKSRDSNDSELRTEVNLRLAQAAGSQLAAVTAFLRPLGADWQRSLRKQILVYSFADCEVVHYTAATAEKQLHCVEFEALDCASLDDARQVLGRYEAHFGFSDRRRATQSLFDLLLADSLPAASR